MGFIQNHARLLRKNATPAERMLWEMLRGYRKYGYPFRRQHPLGKRRINDRIHYYVADFCCIRLKLVIELDGEIHDQQQDHDSFRQAFIEQLGYSVIRFRNEEVLQNPTLVIKQIETFMDKYK